MDKPTSQEEEYNFSDEQAAPVVAEKESVIQRPTITSNNSSRRKLFLIIGLIVAIFCLYKLYEVFVSTSMAKKPVALPAPVVRPIATTTNNQSIEKPQDINTKPIFAQEESAQTMGVSEQLNALKNTTQQNQQATQNLQQEISSLSNAISDIQNNLATINQKMTELKTPPPAPAIKKKHYTKQIKKKIVKPPVIKNFYYARAMIAGRAWLINSEGNTFTVSLGDDIPGYGIVTMINPDNGTLMTSSGRLIGYHPQDK